MFKQYPIWLRAVEGAETGGSSSESSESETGNEDTGSTDGDQDGEPDWKARYEQAQADAEKWKAHSRKWEDRAKAKHDESGDDGADIRARLAEVEQSLKDARAEAERAEAERLKYELGAEFGLAKTDVDLLRGSEDEMRALAQRLGEQPQQRYPESPNQGRGSQPSSKQKADDWYAELTGKNS